MSKNLKITPVKGRPMIHWVDKKPLEEVRYFPAQLCETVGVESPPAEPSYEKFMESKHNLIFHGDNKEVLSSLLIAGFRGKVDLIYIDPPFDSGADYVRQVKLRGLSKKLEGESHTSFEQAQYEDIWANDNYLQFMYERLILMRELLSEKGSMYLHCDWHKSHHLRFLLDEVFGEENFMNEIVWAYSTQGRPSDKFARKHDTLFVYAKKIELHVFNVDSITVPYTDEYIQSHFRDTDDQGKICRIRFEGNKRRIYYPEGGMIPNDFWPDIHYENPMAKSRTDFPTQKPEALLERIIKASSNEDSIVLDCFCGSGTAAAVAEKLGRRWIVADLNKGAIQTTIKRLQEVIKGKNGDLAEKNGRGLLHYRVNNYDCAKQNGLKRLIINKYGIEVRRNGLFFDGIIGGQLAKIVDLDKPLTRLDIQIIRDEIQLNRPDETRDITVFCNGSELGIIDELAKEKNPVNRITIRDIQQDGMIAHQPAQADVQITRKGKQATVRIADYISPSILARLDIDRTLFNEQIEDFRAQIDCVLIDTDYNGRSFNIVESDLPRRKTDFIEGAYQLSLPRSGAKVAVKIVDMLGEETMIAA